MYNGCQEFLGINKFFFKRMDRSHPGISTHAAEPVHSKLRFIPSILKICPVSDGQGIYIQWNTPKRRCNPPVVGYIIAYKRSHLDVNYSSRCILGGRSDDVILTPSRSSAVYDIKIAAFSTRIHGDFSPPISWSIEDKDETLVECTDTLKKAKLDVVPTPKIMSATSVLKGHGIKITWQVPHDVTSVLVEGFLVAYKRCGFDARNTVKLVPGADSKEQILDGLQQCTLYEMKVAAFTGDGKGRYSIPVIIRTGVQKPKRLVFRKQTVPTHTPHVISIYPVFSPLGIFVKWQTPKENPISPILGHVIAFREAKALEIKYQKCYIEGDMDCHLLRGVRPGTNYEVIVAAYNAAGEGQFTMAKHVTVNGELPAGIPILLDREKGKVILKIPKGSKSIKQENSLKTNHSNMET